MKRNSTTKDLRKKSDEIYIEVTEGDYQASLAKGLEPETLLKPGRHKFIRGGFKKMHPDFDPKEAKVQIATYLDEEIYNYLRHRTGQTEGEPSPDQINQVLRILIEQDKKNLAQGPASAVVVNLLDDPRFAELLDARIAAQLAKQKRKRKAA